MGTTLLEAKVRVTSEGFNPGWDCDRRIADLLGVPVENEVPRYCDTPGVTLDLLRARCDTVLTLPNDSGSSSVVFTHLDGLCVATGASLSYALASALLCSLEERAKVREV